MGKIELVQGDTSGIYKFQRKYKGGGVITTLPQKMWITFKKSTNYTEAVFQKTLDDGIEFSEDDYYYRFQILPNDTNNLCCDTYGYDIAIINEIGEKKTLLKNGVLKIEDHYTHKNNEV